MLIHFINSLTYENNIENKMLEAMILPIIKNKEIQNVKELKRLLTPILKKIYKQIIFLWIDKLYVKGEEKTPNKTFYIHITIKDRQRRALLISITQKKLDTLQKICLWKLSSVIKTEEDIEKLNYFQLIPKLIKEDIKQHVEKSRCGYF